jgi:hypothetical protein
MPSALANGPYLATVYSRRRPQYLVESGRRHGQQCLTCYTTGLRLAYTFTVTAQHHRHRSSIIPGPAGPADALSIGTVTTGAAGSNASVTLTGTSPSQVMNFTIPAGATGPQGPAGPQGPVGPQGPAGPTATLASYFINDRYPYQWRDLDVATGTGRGSHRD